VVCESVTVRRTTSGEEEVEITSTDDLHAWLAEHHTSSAGAWLVTWKKGRGPCVPYGEVVRELLCFGWIDSRARGVDDDRSSVWIAPRRPGGGWSRVNKEHLEVLEAAGRMQPAGRAAVDRAKGDGSWTKLDEVETLREPDDLRTALDAVPDARRAWDTFPPSARRALLEWVSSAKKQPTRDRRVATTVAEAAAGRRANQWRPPEGR
jgi:uncharacterized protein YdeI (YjbR/CyaY-like superfamily)